MNYLSEPHVTTNKTLTLEELQLEGMPKRKHPSGKCIGTSSQSAVEIQVSRNQATVTAVVSPHTSGATSNGQITSTGSKLVKPTDDFLEILRTTGAEGNVFSMKEVLFYLKEYISTKQLYDPVDPRIVHCSTDQLGKVFECDQFSAIDVFGLINRKSSTIEDTVGWWKESHTKPPGVSSVPETVGDCRNVTTAASNESESCIKNVKRRRRRKKQKSGKSDHSSDKESADRKSSWSVTCGSDSDSGSLYFVVKASEDSASEVLSIQGYETAVVQSSSDDLWFLEDVEIESDGGFSVEYDVDSDNSKNSGANTEILESSDEEEIYVTFQDSDVDCFADLDDSDSESDLEISPQDKWRCSECDMLNSPLQRCCSRCWKLRPGWLPEQRPTFKRRSYRRSISAPAGDLSWPNPKLDGTKCVSSSVAPLAQSAMGFYSDPSDSDLSDAPRKRKKLKRSNRHIEKSSVTPCFESKFIAHGSDVTDGPPSKVIENTDDRHEIRCELNATNTESPFSFSGKANKADNDTTKDVIPDEKDSNDRPLFSFVGLKQFGNGMPGNVQPSSKECKQTSMDLEISACDSRESVSLFCGGSNKRSKTLSEVDGGGSSLKTDSNTIVHPAPALVSRTFSSRHLALHAFDWKTVNTPTAQNSTISSHQSSSHYECCEVSQFIDPVSKKLPMASQVAKSSAQTSSQASILIPEDKCEKSTPLPSNNDESVPSSSAVNESVPSSLAHNESVPSSLAHNESVPSSLAHNESVPSSSVQLSSESIQKDVETSGTEIPRSIPSTSGIVTHSHQTSARFSQGSDTNPTCNDLCVICLSRPKDSSIVHGKTGHQICCYSCAKRLRRRGKSCPVCRRPIQKVIKNFLM